MDVRTRVVRMLLPGLLGACMLWSVWPSLRAMEQRWDEDPKYSHGFLVPAFSAFLLWHRRGVLAPGAPRAGWPGLAVVALGAAVRLLGARYYVVWLESVSILFTLTGIALIAGGTNALRWAGPSIGFLFFMIPLPYRVEYAMGLPLQRLATLASNYAMQTLGLPTVAEGNIILLDDFRIGVVEACNGLGMLFTFFSIAVAVAVLAGRRAYENALVILSAVPIALMANVARITLTGVLHATAGNRLADAVYHDLAGWLMMPLALAALGLELLLLSRLIVEEDAEQPVAFDALMPLTVPARHPGGR